MKQSSHHLASGAYRCASIAGGRCCNTLRAAQPKRPYAAPVAKPRNASYAGVQQPRKDTTARHASKAIIQVVGRSARQVLPRRTELTLGALLQAAFATRWNTLMTSWSG